MFYHVAFALRLPIYERKRREDVRFTHTCAGLRQPFLSRWIFDVESSRDSLARRDCSRGGASITLKAAGELTLHRRSKLRPKHSCRIMSDFVRITAATCGRQRPSMMLPCPHVAGHLRLLVTQRTAFRSRKALAASSRADLVSRS